MSVQLLRDPLLKARVVEAGRARAVEHFSADAIVPRYEALYERVVEASA